MLKVNFYLLKFYIFYFLLDCKNRCYRNKNLYNGFFLLIYKGIISRFSQYVWDFPFFEKVYCNLSSPISAGVLNQNNYFVKM